MKLAQLLLLKKLIFIHWTSVKINGITNLTHKVIFKTWSFPAWDKFCFPSRCALTCFDFRRQRAGVWFPSVTVFQMRAPRFGCHRSKWQFCLRILQIFWIIRQVVSLDGESLDSWATTNNLWLLYDPKEAACFFTHQWNVGTNPNFEFAIFGQCSRLPDRHVLGTFSRSQHRPCLMTICTDQGCVVSAGVAMRRRFLGEVGVGFLGTLGIGVGGEVGCFYPLRKSNWVIFTSHS